MSDESIKIWKGQLEEVGSLRRRFEPLSSEAVKDEWEVGFSRTVEEPSRKDEEAGAWHTLGFRSLLGCRQTWVMEET